MEASTQTPPVPEQPQPQPRRPSQARQPEPPEAPTEELSGSQRERDLIQRAKDEQLQDTEIHDALEVFLAAEGETAWEPKELKLNIGSDDSPKYVKWVIGPIEDTEITKIRETSRKGGNRAQRRSGGAGDVDESLVARKIVARATIEPDVTALSRQLHMADPSDAVYAYFRKFGKTGLVSMISGEILAVSGWDDEGVQEIEPEAVRG